VKNNGTVVMAIKRSALFVVAATLAALGKDWSASRFFALWAVTMFCYLTFNSLETPSVKRAIMMVGILIPPLMTVLEFLQQRYIWALTWAVVTCASIWSFLRQKASRDRLKDD